MAESADFAAISLTDEHLLGTLAHQDDAIAVQGRQSQTLH